MSGSDPGLLELEGVTKRFGGLTAVDRVDLEVRPGTIHGLIGPNGSGKTTLFNLVTGFLPADGGEVRFRGARLTRAPAHRVVAAGIGRTFQQTEVFPEMTARENVMVGTERLFRAGPVAGVIRPRWAVAEEQEIAARAERALQFVGLDALGIELARNLPYGTLRLVEIARALAADPELLLLDEPGAGMPQAEIDGLMKLIERIRATGKTVLLVEHNMRMVMRTCQRVSVLNYGRKIAEGTPAEVQRDPGVIAAYLGTARASG